MRPTTEEQLRALRAECEALKATVRAERQRRVDQEAQAQQERAWAAELAARVAARDARIAELEAELAAFGVMPEGG